MVQARLRGTLLRLKKVRTAQRTSDRFALKWIRIAKRKRNSSL